MSKVYSLLLMFPVILILLYDPPSRRIKEIPQEIHLDILGDIMHLLYIYPMIRGGVIAIL